MKYNKDKSNLKLRKDSSQDYNDSSSNYVATNNYHKLYYIKVQTNESYTLVTNNNPFACMYTCMLVNKYDEVA